MDGPEIELNPIVPCEIEFKASQWGPFTPEHGKLGSISKAVASWGAYNPHEGFYSNTITHIALFPLTVFMAIQKPNEPYNSLLIVGFKSLSLLRRNAYFIVSWKLISNVTQGIIRSKRYYLKSGLGCRANTRRFFSSVFYLRKNME